LYYAFATTFLSLAFFKKKFATDDFDLIKHIIHCLYRVSPVAPWNLQETIDPTNDPSSFMGLVKALLASGDLFQATIDGDGTHGNRRILGFFQAYLHQSRILPCIAVLLLSLALVLPIGSWKSCLFVLHLQRQSCF